MKACRMLITNLVLICFAAVSSVAAAVVAVSNPIKNADPADYLDSMEMPAGFKIELYATDVPGARSMALGDNGTIFVGTRGKGRAAGNKGSIYAVVDKDGDYQADQVIELDDDLFMPNGIATRDGSLYVAEPNRVLRYDDIENQLNQLPDPVVVNDSYPSETHHGWKYIQFGPDGRLYVPVGAPCNICESSEDYAVITSIKADGSDKRIEARGVRNTVGFDFHPQTGELWFSENGRDRWGDDRPPEELNRVSNAGQHFGYPYEYGNGLRDGEFKVPDIEFTGATVELPPHTAPLGLKFYTGDMFPEEYRNQILIPHHGSWNRSEPDGFYLSLVRFDAEGNPQPHEIFASGWLQDGKYWGRPVDLLQLPDGSMLLSDDYAGVIYRISYSKPDSE
ncbi:MAG: PQQ-dependent sugar dehydrogenase [Pseudomonadota bacterium]